MTLVDNTNFEHSRTVSQISRMMASRAGFSGSECQVIAQAALCHDVGKAAIPAAILNKPSSLTSEEYEVVKTHTEAGYAQITETIQTLSIAAIIARQHHEHENGNGYNHLAGADIHPYAKLVAVADVFDALYSRRSYKEPWSVGSIRDYFNQQAGQQFDKATVSLLFSILSDVLFLYESQRTERRRST
ncbi:MAG: HD-GYP domain-containing protein [Porticoccaceae bacterium]